jgi:(p)ppGpp synthase/HD superfamily hydrolase
MNINLRYNKDKKVDQAILLATHLHKGHKDKAGLPYIYHPLRVMLALDDENEKVVAVLHDVVEDTSITCDDLTDLGYPHTLVYAIDSISKQKGENLKQYITRVKKNPIAKNVKIADISDNMSPGRLMQLDENTRKRLKEKYADSLRWLLRDD